jgi:hypothetical protein
MGEQHFNFLAQSSRGAALPKQHNANRKPTFFNAIDPVRNSHSRFY